MTILIKNVQLIDGTGKAPVKTDILVKSKRISAIGNLTDYRANEVIDGMGAYLAPGFIDIHSSQDRYLSIWNEPDQKNLLLQGVTTIIGGQDGISLAPLVYGSLKLLQDWTDTRKINVHWHSASELLKILEKRGLGINFGTLIGYETVRKAMVGAEERSLTPNEIKVLQLLMEHSLKEGAFGVSFGEKSPYYEVKNLLEVVSKKKALYVPRGSGATMNRIIKLAEESEVKTIISHLEPLEKDGAIYEQILKTISSSSSRADVFFEVYPAESTIVQAETLRGLKKIKGDEINIVSVPAHRFLDGQSLKTFSANRGIAMTKGLERLIELSEGQAIVSYKNINFASVLKAVGHDRAIIASTDNHLKKIPAANLLKFLEKIEKEKILPIETAVWKLTGLPAQRLGLQNRGVVRIGNFADLVLFRGTEVKEVILNGRRVVKDGKFEDILAGEILRHQI